MNPYWPYSQDKIACEALLTKQDKLPWTIVRPSHTVRSGLPTMMNEGDVVAHRMLAGKPVIVCGDGTNPWTLTRSEDLAVPSPGARREFVPVWAVRRGTIANDSSTAT